MILVGIIQVSSYVDTLSGGASVVITIDGLGYCVSASQGVIIGTAIAEAGGLAIKAAASGAKLIDQITKLEGGHHAGT